MNDFGINGTLILDLPVELASDFLEEARRYEVDFIFLVSPNTSKNRMETITENSTGFIYVVQRYGVTGESEDIYLLIKKCDIIVKRNHPKAYSSGLWNNKVEHIKKLVDMGADAVIMGSHLIKLISSGIDYQKFEENIKSIIKAI